MIPVSASKYCCTGKELPHGYTSRLKSLILRLTSESIDTQMDTSAVNKKLQIYLKPEDGC
jgi:hypothetical protein